MNTLLLIDSASPDQVYAAAAALRAFSDADLRIVNWREGCDILEGSAYDYDTVLILGVSLLYDITRTAMALNELREVGCKVHYFTQDQQYFTPPPLSYLMNIHCDPTWLANALLNYYEMGENDLRYGAPECQRHYQTIGECISAAWEYLHETQDDQPYRQLIVALSQDSDPATWSLALQELHRHWLRHAPHPLPLCSSEAWTELRQQIDQILPTWWQETHVAVPILLQGEPGTPLRDLATHFQCPALHAFDCAIGDETMLRKAILRADRTALLMEEIGSLPLSAQQLVLETLKTGWLTSMNDRRHALHLRWIFTTHQDLDELVQEERLLPELRQRLLACELTLPPLRERLDDLETLVNEACRRRGCEVPFDALTTLQGYDFPGNEAELAILLERASLSSPDEFRQFIAERKKIPSLPEVTSLLSEPSPGTLESAMRRHVRAVVEQCGGNKSQAAHRLGITRTTLRKYL